MLDADLQAKLPGLSLRRGSAGTVKKYSVEDLIETR